MSRLLVVLAAALSPGCIASATFQTARALGAAEIEHAIGVEVFVFDRGSSFGNDAVPTPPWPSYGLRVGLGHGLEVGGKVSYPRLAADLKYNPLQTERLDLAIALGAWGELVHGPTSGEPTALVGVDLLALADVVLAEGLVLVPAAGAALVESIDPDGDALGIRASLGLRVDVSDLVSLHPEVGTLIDPALGRPIEWVFGFGVLLGDHARGG